MDRKGLHNVVGKEPSAAVAEQYLPRLASSLASTQVLPAILCRSEQHSAAVASNEAADKVWAGVITLLDRCFLEAVPRVTVEC